MKKQVKKKTNKIRIILIAALVVILIAAFTAFLIVKNEHTPLSCVENMFSLRADMRLEEYYNCFDIPDYSRNAGNSLEAYLDMASQKGWGKIDSYTVKEINDFTFDITYGDVTERLQIVPSEEKTMGIFNNYKIKIESVSSPLMYIVTHKGAEITLDSKPLTNKVVESDIVAAYNKAQEEAEASDIPKLDSISRKTPIDYFEYYDDIYDNYCLINVFDKEYSAEVKTDYTQPYTEVLSPSEEPCILRDLILTDESEALIKEASENFMKKYYYAMQDGEDFDAIAHLITKDEEKREAIRLDYEELFDMFVRGEDKSGLIDICFLESESTVNYPSVYSLNQAEYIAYVTLSYSYNYRSFNGLLKEYELTSDAMDETLFVLYVAKEDGSWVITKIEDTTLDMSI